VAAKHVILVDVVHEAVRQGCSDIRAVLEKSTSAKLSPVTLIDNPPDIGLFGTS
jgi:hypothetical protein